MALTEKQKRFCEYYAEEPNATQAAIKAGYKKKAAYATGAENLRKPQVREYIDQLLEQARSARVATVQEVMEYLTSVMRREQNEHVVITIKEEKSYYAEDSDGKMRKRTDKTEKAEIVKIPSKVSDANKAAELLGKRFGMWGEKQSEEKNMGIVPDILKAVGDIE